MQTKKPTPRQLRWQRRLNNLLYDTLAPLYNAMDWLTFGAWWRLVRSALEHIPDHGDVLEVGFGPGKLQREISKRVDRCYGLDLSCGMCQLTKRRLRESGLPVRLTRGNALALPFPSESFDTVVSTFTHSGLPEGQVAILEMTRVLQAAGSLVMVDIGVPSDGNVLGTWLSRLWEAMGDVLYDQPELIRSAGLTITQYREFGPGRHIRLIVAERPA
jgi:ubiquinone/menaquinone biosynthesis C-methylase UbiE